MVRKACCSDLGLNRGPWTPEEDALLKNYVQTHGEGHWSILPHKAGLVRCGRSCRLRWMNYLRPDVKHDNISAEEEELIIKLHNLLGNRWSLIASRMPGRTDNQIKNVWYSRLSKKLAKSTKMLHCNVQKPLLSNEAILTANEKKDENCDNATNIFQTTNYCMHYEKEIEQACEESIGRLPEWAPLTAIYNPQSLVGSSDNSMERGLYWASNLEVQLNCIEGSSVENGIDITLENSTNWYNIRPYFDPALISEQDQESRAAPSPFHMNYNNYGAVNSLAMEPDQVTDQAQSNRKLP